MGAPAASGLSGIFDPKGLDVLDVGSRTCLLRMATRSGVTDRSRPPVPKNRPGANHWLDVGIPPIIQKTSIARALTLMVDVEVLE